MVKTHGLTHVARAVRNAERAFAFYEKVLGVVAVYRDKGLIQAQTPGTRDVIVFDEKAERPGEHGGVAHFGFRLVDPRHRCSGSSGARRWRNRYEPRRVRAGRTLRVLHRSRRLRGGNLVRAADAD